MALGLCCALLGRKVGRKHQTELLSRISGSHPGCSRPDGADDHSGSGLHGGSQLPSTGAWAGEIIERRAP